MCCDRSPVVAGVDVPVPLEHAGGACLGRGAGEEDGERDGQDDPPLSGPAGEEKPWSDEGVCCCRDEGVVNWVLEHRGQEHMGRIIASMRMLIVHIWSQSNARWFVSE